MKKSWSKLATFTCGSAFSFLLFICAVTFFPSIIDADTNVDTSKIFNYSQDLDVDPTTGAASISIPIEVPAGRQNIQPAINLLYNSSGGNGILGMGWSMELGAIERSTKRGTPKYNNQDTYVLTLGGSHQELVDVSNGQGINFRPKHEGSFMRIQFNGMSWTITDKTGKKYYFGTSADSRLSNPDDHSKVYSWRIDRMEDLSGNYLTVVYVRENSQILLSKINYTGNTNAKLPTYAQVLFNYEDRASENDYQESYKSGFKIALTNRLKSIETFVEGHLIQRYQMNYIIDPEVKRSLLNSVTLFGSDGVTTLPPTVMTYSQSQIQYSLPISANNHPTYTNYPRLIWLADMNGDGKSDILFGWYQGWKIYFNQTDNGKVSFSSPVDVVNSPRDQYQLGSTDPNLQVVDLNGDGLLDVIYGNKKPYKIWINNGVNGFNAPVLTSNSPETIIGDQNLVQFVDMNGDGKIDIVETTKTSEKPWKVFFNTTGSDFAPSILVANSPSKGMDNQAMRIADFNGDGLPDVVLGELPQYTFWINNGTDGFHPPTKAVFSSANNSVGQLPFRLDDDRVQLADMNGDGLIDFVSSIKNPINSKAEYTFYFNMGNLIFEKPIIAVNSPAYLLDEGSGRGYRNVQLVDINGDNLPDILRGFNTTTQGWGVSINNGNNGFQPEILIRVPIRGEIGSQNVVLADINTDGKVDTVLISPGGDSWEFYLSQYDSRSSRPSSLIDIDNSFGGHLEIQYQNLPVKGLIGFSHRSVLNPYLFNSVKSISNRASLISQAYVTQYEYQGGMWDHKSDEFRGFQTVKVMDPEGNYTITEYAQDDIFKGREVSKAIYDQQNRLLNKSVNTWDYEMLANNVIFPFLKKTDAFVYDGDDTGRRTQVEYAYGELPQYGNITKIINWGEVDLQTGQDVGLDKTTLEKFYYNNPKPWLIGITKYVNFRDQNNRLVQHSRFFYDNRLNLVDVPLKGQLTQKYDWAGLRVYPSAVITKYKYDEVGNVISITDGNNHTTMMNYDPQYKMFLMDSTNAVGHRISNEYYGLNNVPLNDEQEGTHGVWGQLKSTTDPNNHKSLRIYDALGRIAKVVSALDSVEFPSMSYEYVYGAWQLKVVSKQRILPGYPGTMDTVQFYDGLGRLMQTKTRSEVGGRFIVTGQSEFNSRGLSIKNYTPYFTTTALTEMDTIDPSKPFVEVTYDALGRVIKYSNPDGTYSNMVYSDGTVATYDENGHFQKTYSDAYGRLLKKEEYSGADGRHSAYPQSPYTLYATTQYTHDEKGNLVKIQDAKGNVTTIVYDALNRKIQMSDPDMGTWRYGYDAQGNMLWQEDAKWQRTYFKYDDINRLKQKSSLNVLTVNYLNDDPKISDSKGRLTSVNYGGGKTDFVYDPLGRATKTIKSIGSNQYQFNQTYDNVNRLVTVQYPDASKVGYVYNNAGLVNSVFQVLPTTEMPKPIDNVNSRFVPSPFTQYRFNEIAQNAAVFDYGMSKSHAVASENTTNLSGTGKIENAFRLNGTSQYVKIENFIKKVRNDAVGSLALWVKPEGWSTLLNVEYSTVDAKTAMGAVYLIWDSSTKSVRFDAITLQTNWTILLRCSTPINSVPAGVWSHVAVIQDGVGIKVYVNGIEQALTYTYQNNKAAWFNQVQGVIRTASIGEYFRGQLKGSIDDFRYYSNKALKPEEVLAIYNNGFGTESENPLVIDPGTDPRPPASAGQIYVKNIDYNNINQITKVEFGNGVVTNYVYSPLTFRLEKLSTVNAVGNTLQDLTYTYDGVGNILSIANGVNSSTQFFKYDALNRLIESSSPSYGTKKYAYDQIGNIVEKDGLTYSYSKVSAGPHAVTSLSNGTMIYYDVNGNMIRKSTPREVLEYFYDKENRLIKVRKNLTWIAEYLYDGDGGRVQKVAYVATVKNVQPGEGFGSINTLPSIVTTPVVTKYVGDLYEEVGNVGTNFIFAGNHRIAAIDTATGSLQYYHRDHLGSTNIMTDQKGDRTELLEYDPYGKIVRHEAKAGNNQLAQQQFTGKRLDDETGLVYFGARYYDPSLGRFITPDQVVQDMKDSQSLNRYSYTSNNPINRIDPDGHRWRIGNIFKGIGILALGVALSVATGGLLAPIIGTYLTGVVTGAIVGASIGGGFAAAAGLNIGKGMLAGALSGAITAGISGLINLGTQAAGQTLTTLDKANISFYSSVTSNIIQSEINGVGVDINGALRGGLYAAASSVLADAAALMREKMIEQSFKNPLNSSGKSVGYNGDGVKVGGGRFDPFHPNANPSPLGGYQGGVGRIGFSVKYLGFEYKAGSFWDRLVETYAGPHDFLNSWTYDSITGNIRQLNFIESVGAFVGNIVNVGLATPFALVSSYPDAWYPPPVSVYGEPGK